MEFFFHELCLICLFKGDTKEFLIEIGDENLGKNHDKQKIGASLYFLLLLLIPSKGENSIDGRMMSTPSDFAG